jgi:hypothetical protein
MTFRGTAAVDGFPAEWGCAEGFSVLGLLGSTHALRLSANNGMINMCFMIITRKNYLSTL